MSLVLVDHPAAGVSQITLNRPEQLNAMTADLVEELHDALAAVAGDRSCRVVVLTGAGRAFCAGLDLQGYGTPPGAEDLPRVPAGMATQNHLSSLVPRMRALSVPVIAAGRTFDVDEADRMGLLTRVVPDGQVVDAALETAAQIVENSPWGVRMTKEVMWSQLEIGSLSAGIELENRTQILSAQTGDSQVAIEAFLNKRPPVWD